ncbi:hypothetical protein HPB51_021939 [Rhipicephalus microplus]|uniref:Uncharacterized protein n=1 Tax=Rhipicephalus microplus TaxID=6941 RepID=A0A9J6F9P5_RHIMP|nr:hypothetical protein HPB51_021939 [Rhipicephalus microplus]
MLTAGPRDREQLLDCERLVDRGPLRYQERRLELLDWDLDLFGQLMWRCRLPPHAHIVEMPVAFVDSVSLLPGATVLWPSALSPRLHPGGCGRNATLYLVMRRATAPARPETLSVANI